MLAEMMYTEGRKDMKIEGKNVLITGASSGIGLALATILAGRGAVLALASRRIVALQKVATKLSLTLPNIISPLIVPCDVADREHVRNMIRNCVDHLGGVDMVINNAGICVYGRTENVPLEDFHAVMDVNYFGSLHCMLEVIPYMKRLGGGGIVNIASVAAKHGVPYMGAYSASKAALAALSESLRTELSEYGIWIMNVYPGYTQTDFFKKEKKVGGARRPPEPYTSPQKVAKSIVRASQREKRDLVLSREGKALTFFKNSMPWLVERAMERIALQLRDKKEVSHE